MAEKTQVDKIFARIKNNPTLAVIIALGVIVIALSTFTNAARNLLGLFSNGSVDVVGVWKTPVLTNQFNKNQKLTFTFEFDVKGSTLLGALTRTTIGDNRSQKQGILGGIIEGNNISFYIQETSLLGQKRESYKNLFHGTVSDGEIEFIQNSDRSWGFVPQKFIAKKVN
jgi:hypothetical protein